MCRKFVDRLIPLPNTLYISTVLTRLNAAAFIKFLAFLMRRLFKGGVYSREAFISNHISSITDNNYGKSFAKIA